MPLTRRFHPPSLQSRGTVGVVRAHRYALLTIFSCSNWPLRAVSQATELYRAINSRSRLADWRFGTSPPHHVWTDQKPRRSNRCNNQALPAATGRLGPSRYPLDQRYSWSRRNRAGRRRCSSRRGNSRSDNREDNPMAQHPEWIEANGDCPTCDSYDRRLAELITVFESATRGPLTQVI